MSHWIQRLLFVGKGASLFYWLWFAKAIAWPTESNFDSIVAATGPLMASLHFVQLLIVTRRLDARGSFAKEALLTLLFGAFHIAGRLQGSRANARP